MATMSPKKIILSIAILFSIYSGIAQDGNNVLLPQLVEVNATEIVERKTFGEINWTQQYVEATGESVIDTSRFKNKAQATAMANRGAIVVAQRNLLEIIQGVQVNSETTVQDMMVVSDQVKTNVSGVIRGAQVFGEPEVSFGLVRVKMRVSLYKNGGLAPSLISELPVESIATSGEESSANNARLIEDKEGLPKESTSKKKRKKENKQAAKESRSRVKDLVKEEINDVIEQVIFNLNGQDFDPALFPKIIDEKGKELLDLAKIYKDKAGKFPQFVQGNADVKEIIEKYANVKIINVLKSDKGRLVVETAKDKLKVNWKKIGEVVSKVGKFLLI